MSKPLISDEEMALLLTPLERKLLKGADAGFKLRNQFLVLAVVSFVIRLLFFSDEMSIGLNLVSTGRDLRPYLQYRGIFIGLITAAYFYSYYRDWYFERISMLMVGMIFTGLVMDFFNVYSLIDGPIAADVLFFIFLRLAVIWALLLNAIRAHRAPPMPRSFWR